MKELPNLVISPTRVTTGSPKQVENLYGDGAAILPKRSGQRPRQRTMKSKTWNDSFMPYKARVTLTKTAKRGEVRQFPNKTILNEGIGSADAS
jgi:hypothetical protein